MKLLLDTSVLIDVLRARNQRRELLADLARAGHTLATRVLNVAALYSGTPRRRSSDGIFPQRTGRPARRQVEVRPV